jgi:transposase
MAVDTTITHEPVDDVPVIIAWLLAMRLDVLVDSILPQPHGNWKGLTYGQVVVLWLARVLSQADHRLCPVEEWVAERLEVLRSCTGWPVMPQDLTDDRLEIVLDLLGDEESRPWEVLDREMGRHLIQAYRLPTDVGRIDTTSFSVYHGESGPNGESYSLLQFGKSKDHRPDLTQFIQALGTLDPAGVPLVSTMLRGNQNDSPVYLPIWRQMVEIIGRPDFLLVGDCKLSSLINRVQLHLAGGLYLSPLAMTGQWPAVLQDWVLDPPLPVEEVSLPEQQPGEEPAYRGFVMELGTLGRNSTTQERVGWMEQVFVVCNTHTAWRENQALHQRLERAESALARLAQRPGSDPVSLQQRVTALLEKEKVADYLQVTIQDTVILEERLVGRGRRGPNRQTRVVEKHKLEMTVTRQVAAIDQAEKLAGWRLYVTNASPEQMSLEQSIAYYRGQWQPEQGFHRLKRGGLPVLPVYLKYEQRIRGLMVVLSVGLRVLTLVEFVVRRELEQHQEKLPGLYEGNRKRATDRPTTERLFRAFTGIVLYRSQTGDQVSYQLTPLTDLQKRILNLMSLPVNLYARLVPGAEFVGSGEK